MREAEKGQILMVVILAMVVALTIGLSVAGRTITSLRTSTEEENSQRAFSAAEAGIERSLVSNLPVTGNFSNNATYSTSISSLTGSSFLLNNGLPVLKDDAVDVWLSTYPGFNSPFSGNFTVYWGKTTDVCNNSEASNSMAALEVIVLSGTKNNPSIMRYALDPCQQRANLNRFSYIPQGGGTFSNKTFAFKRTITVNSGLIARIIPIYSSALIGVVGCDGNNNNCLQLPPQGTVIESVGKSDNTQRKIITVRSHPKLPVELFSYTVFSPK